MPHPVHAHYAEPSLAFSAEDDYSQPSDRLVSLALEAARLSRGVGLDELDLRWAQTGPPSERHPYLRPSCWPGEHYRLLAGLTLAVRPQLVVEVGTGGGLSALAIKKYLPVGSQIATFDIIGWRAGRSFNVLTASDFEDGSLVQYLADLATPEAFAQYVPLLRRAKMVFIDGARNGKAAAQFSPEGRCVEIKRGRSLASQGRKTVSPGCRAMPTGLPSHSVNRPSRTP